MSENIVNTIEGKLKYWHGIELFSKKKRHTYNGFTSYVQAYPYYAVYTLTNTSLYRPLNDLKFKTLDGAKHAIELYKTDRAIREEIPISRSYSAEYILDCVNNQSFVIKIDEGNSNIVYIDPYIEK